jgi:C_GCAxxG_C_C family probable redox protein
MQEAWDLDGSCIPQIATPFGGGISRHGYTCGAVTGACMALGLRTGRRSPDVESDPCYQAVQKFMAKFRKEFGETACLVLTGIDISTPEGRVQWEVQGLDKKCSDLVAWAVGELYDMFPSNS